MSESDEVDFLGHYAQNYKRCETFRSVPRHRVTTSADAFVSSVRKIRNDGEPQEELHGVPDGVVKTRIWTVVTPRAKKVWDAELAALLKMRGADYISNLEDWHPKPSSLPSSGGLNHPGLSPTISHWIRLSQLLPYYNRGDLQEYLERERLPHALDLDTIHSEHRKFALEIVRGVLSLAEAELVNANLKLKDILLHSESAQSTP